MDEQSECFLCEECGALVISERMPDHVEFHQNIALMCLVVKNLKDQMDEICEDVD